MPSPQKVKYHRKDLNCIFPGEISNMKSENKAVQSERGKRNICLVTTSVQKMSMLVCSADRAERHLFKMRPATEKTCSDGTFIAVMDRYNLAKQPAEGT